MKGVFMLMAVVSCAILASVNSEPDQKDHGHIILKETKPIRGPERRPTYSLDARKKVWGNKNGEINAGVGGQRLPGRRIEPTAGIEGRWRF